MKTKFCHTIILLMVFFTIGGCEKGSNITNTELEQRTFQIEQSTANKSLTSPACDTRKLEVWLVSYQQWDLDGYTSEVVCPFSHGGDGSLNITSFGELVETSDGFYFVVEKWSNQNFTWEYYWSSDVFYETEPINVYVSDATGNPFNGMSGNEKFRLRVYEEYLLPTGGGSSPSAVDSIWVRFDLSD